MCSFSADGILGLICKLGELINTLIPIVAGIALLVFFWGLVKFIAKAQDEGARSEGRQLMVWGVIALFVMFSIWGILFFIGDSLGIHEVDNPGGLRPPQVDIQQ